MQRYSPFGAVITVLFSAVLVHTSPAQNIGTARINGAPQINSGTVEGNVQQMTGANVTLNGGAVITGDLLVPGTPTLIKNGTPNFGGTIVGTGSTSPSNYQVILNGSARLGHLRTRTNPVAIPALSPVPSPTGTRTVTITAAGQSAGSFSTLRNLTLNGNVGQYPIPAGTYGDFIANGGSGFTLGVAGATQATVYNFQHLTLNGQTNIIVLGPVVINVANGFTANGTAGTSGNPARLKLNIVSGGFILNGGCNIYGYVNAPNGTVIINGAAKLVGGCISAGLTVNGTGLLQLFDVQSFENHPPVAANQPVTTLENTAKGIVLAATDVDGQTLTYSVVSQPGHGSLSGTPPQLTYTPNHGYYGPDSFTFKANDGQADSNIATVSITVTHVNHAPVANAQSPTLNQGSSTSVTLAGSDADNDPLTFRTTSSPANGALSGTPPNLTYTPVTSFYGTDSFTFVANDGTVDSPPATVSITVIHVNHPPIAAGQSVQANEDTAAAILLSAMDIDSDPLTYGVLTSPTNGTLSGAAPNLTYTPAAHFHGNDSFTFRANDGSANSNTATVQITVVHANHPPSANGQNVSLDEDTTAAITLTGNDPDGDPITFSIVVQPAHGTLTGSAPNVVYTPVPNYFGPDSFAFRTNDGNASSANGVVNLTVRPVNDPPTVQISAPASGAQFDAGDTVHIVATASDIDGTIATFRLLLDGAVVSESLQTSTVTFDLLDVHAGDHSISAVVIDNEGASDASAQVPITAHSQGNGPVQVNAGPDRLISLPSTAHLDGSVTVNGAPAGSNVQLAWQKLSGPGNATFDNSAVLNPVVTFGIAGDYLLKLVATAPEGTGFDTVKVTVLAALQAGPDSPVSNQGREFWMAFLTGEGGHESQYAGADVIISSEVAATGTVEIFRPFQTFDPPGWQIVRTVKSFSVEVGKNTIVDVATAFPASYDGQYEQALQSAIHIQADRPVAVHALNYERFSTDGSLILPTGMLGRNYFVMSYTNSASFVTGDPSLISGTQFAVVAIKNDTEVTITPTASTAAHPAGQPFTVTLQTGDVYRMINLNDPLGDYSGTRVQSNKPVAVFGGHKCASVPGATAACDHLYEQMPPTNLWGRHFVTLPLQTRTGDRFRVMAANNDTRVSINGEIVTTLERGGFYEAVLTQASSIVASQPILLSQFAQSTRVDHVAGDPFLMIVPPFEEFGRNYILSTAQVRLAGQYADVYDNYLSIVVDSAHTSQVSINGQLLLASQFAPIGGSGLSGASIAVAKKSTLDIAAPVPLGAWIYGWAQTESYGFTGGIYGAIDSTAAEFNLTQSSSFAPVGTTHHVRAQLINEVGLLVPGAHVNFVVTGANSANGSGYTAADGSIEFSWQGAQAGTDTVTATAGALTATATLTWISNSPNQPPMVNAGADAIIRSGQPVTLHGLAQDDGLPANGQLTLHWSSLPGLGDVVFANPNAAQTTATFAISGQYRLRLAAFDGQFSGDDDLLVVVDAPPVFHSFQPSADAIDAGGPWSVDISASDPDGILVRVELLDGAQVVATESPNQIRANIHLAASLGAVGTHIMTVRLTDDFGLTTDRSINVNVRPAPIAQILSPADNTSIAAGDSVSFTASASSAGGSIVRVVYQDVTDYPFEIGDGTGSDYQLTWTPSYVGTFRIAATAYDSAGAAGTSAPITVTVLSPGDPTIVITSPEEGSSIYLGQSTTLRADAAAVAPAVVRGVNFYDGYNYVGSDNSPPYETSWFGDGEGAHSLRAEVYDSFGGYASTSITVNVVEPPNLSITLSDPPPNIPIKVNTPTTLEADIENVIGTLYEVDFYVNGGWIGGGSSSSITWTPPAVGVYEIEVVAYSSGPEQSGYTATNITVADLHSPVVEWIAPANGASFAPGGPIVLQAQASDIDSNLATLQLLADGQLLSETPVSGGAGVASFTWVNAGPGWHALTAFAVDDTLQTGSAFARIFVQRTIRNDVLPPSDLTATPASTEVILNWTGPAQTGAVGTVIERKLGRLGVWEEVATVESGVTIYSDGEVESETYYVYRVASLTEEGAISTCSNEAVAITRVALPTYAVIDLGDALEQGEAPQRSTAVGSLQSIDLGAAKAKSISDAGAVLLQGVDVNGQEIKGNYSIWRPAGSTLTHSDEKLKVERITKDGSVVGTLDNTRLHGDLEVSETHGVFWTRDTFENANAMVDLTPTPEAYTIPAVTTQAGWVETDWLLTHSDTMGRSWWTPADPAIPFKSGREILWRARATDRNRLGGLVGEATIVYQARPWLEWRTLAQTDPFAAEHSVPLSDAGSAVRWPAQPQPNSPGWEYLVNNIANFGEATAFAVNDAEVGVGGIGFNNMLPDYFTRFGDNLERTHAMRSTGADGGQSFDDLGTLGDGRYSYGWDINTAGVTVGYSTVAKADEIWRTQGVVWEAGVTTATMLPHLRGTNATYQNGYGYAHAINDQGQVVGQSLAPNTGLGAVQLPAISVAALWSKNAASDPSAPGAQTPHWEAHDLNTRITASATETLPSGQTITYRPWHLNVARGVNKEGWIVGTGLRYRYDAASNTLIEKPRSFLLLPIEVVDLAPKLKDETGTEIADSNKPVSLPKANGMVEENPGGNRIAHREMKVKIGEALKGKKITWSMEAKFTPTGASQPRFRGDWATAAEAHRNRFEASSAYGENGYRAVSQEQGETTVDNNGFTAIRVNVPPWGLNKARIKLQIEGIPTPIDLIDLEVPGVIVIDPGHGIGHAGGSKEIGATGVITGAKEHAIALDIAQRMAADLRKRREADHLRLKVFLTRTGTANVSFPNRTKMARENGCDVYVSIHFNGVETVPLRRHPFGMWDQHNNLNSAEDRALAIHLRQKVQAAIAAVEPEASQNAPTDGITTEQHEANNQKQLDTLSDYQNNSPENPDYNGNIPGYTPCRAALVELEWISNARADVLFNEGSPALSATADRMREEAAKALADGSIEDLRAQLTQ
jgi:N-acetylmuramoyl-L-alanine amidase